MPATDALQPPLTPEERAIVKSYGSWTNFMQSFGLKPWDFDDVDEGMAILRAFTQPEAEEETGKEKGSK